MVFGGISQKANLRRLKYSIELEKTKKELESKINEIPEEKRIEPNIQAICTALDNMKYCVEEEELRKMFSSLIANSINVDKTQYVHPSFGEILKQMTSLDAKIFKSISEQSIFPVIKVCEVKDEKKKVRISKNLIWDEWNGIDNTATSLDNLCRLGLIDISYENYYSMNSIYESLKLRNHIKEVIGMFSTNKSADSIIDFEKGIITITSFGKDFIIACS